MITINKWLAQASVILTQAGVPSSRLDAEIILAHTLRKSRTFLHAHSEAALDARQYEIADARLQLRAERTPIAYIVGHKEFYGRLFRVSPSVLIPRPESEDMIDLLKEHAASHSVHEIVDVGTGSGCLGITAKLELPTAHVSLLDISRHALAMANNNAKYQHAEVAIIKSDLLHNYPYVADVILANLPYVDPDWERSPETQHEPALALFAEDHGQALIHNLLTQSPSRLTSGGALLIEADQEQHQAIIQTALAIGFSLTKIKGLILYLTKN